VGSFLWAGHAITRPKNALLGAGAPAPRNGHHFQGRMVASPAPRNAFLKAGDGMMRPYESAFGTLVGFGVDDMRN
jgi:hypothetical protein